MPEGPEVYTTAQFLHQRFAGKTLTGIYHHTEKCLYGNPTGRDEGEVIRIRSYGKKIIFDLSSNDYLMVALMMEGKLHLQPANKHLHITLRFSDGSKLYYCETRPFGGIYYCHGKEELEACLHNVGPDLIQDDITEEKWLQVWRGLRSKKSICELLLDQKIFSGIGNYLRADILYDAKIHPLSTLHTLTDKLLIRLYRSTMKIIGLAVDENGFSTMSYTLPDGSKGQYEALIYGYKTDPHGYDVEKKSLNGRSIHWVPEIQTRGK